MENKLSSARALHAELGVGLVRVHVHVVHSRVARYKVGGYLKRELHDGSPLKQEQHRLLPENFKFAKMENTCRLSRFISVLWYT